MEENKTVRLESLGIKVDKVTFTLDCSEADIYISCLPSNRYELFNLKEYHNFISVDKYEYTRFIISQIADTNPGHMVLRCHVFPMNSVDSIIVEKSHSDEPGERGEQGTTSCIPLFSDVVDVWDYDISGKKHTAIVRARKTSKTMDSIKGWFSTKPPRLYYYILEEGSQNFYFLNSVEVKQDLAIFELSYYGSVMPSKGVSFSVPTLAGPRGTKPLQSGMLTYTDTSDAGSKDVLVCTKQKSLSETLFEMSPAVKSTLEREMDLLQRCKVNSYLFEREEAQKFPQMRRARLNKPKSI